MIEQVAEYKHKIMLKLLSSENIRKAVANTEKNFKDTSVPENYNFLYNHVYPYKRVPPVTEEQKTFITISVGNIRLVNNKFIVGKVRFYIFTHTEGLMQTAYGITRTDFIAAEIHKIFDETRDLGIGKLQFSIMDDLEVNDHFFGVYLEYENYDFK